MILTSWRHHFRNFSMLKCKLNSLNLIISSVFLPLNRRTIVTARQFEHVSLSSCLTQRKLYCCKCGIQHENGLHCPSCLGLQEPSKLNYFELLGVNVSYDIDPKIVVSRYHNLQILFHPDKHSNEDEESQRKSKTLSTMVNKAYSTLIDPLERGLYFLKLNDVNIDETTSSQNPDLLMLILQYNDEISHVKEPDDAQKILLKVDSELENLSELASVSFKEEDFETAKDIMIRMKYYRNVKKTLKAKVQEMEWNI